MAFSILNIGDEVKELGASEKRVASKTLLKTEHMRLLLIAIKSGAKMPDHHVDAPITIHVIAGRVKFSAGKKTVEMNAGMIQPLEPSVVHSVEATEASALLVTMAWPSVKKLKAIEHRGY